MAFAYPMSIFKLNISLMLVFFSNGLAQMSESLIVHEAVGERIEKSERELYALFPEIPNFHAASFVKTDSNEILLKIETSEKKGKISTEVYPVSLFLVEQIHQQIESYLTGQTVPKAEVIDIGIIERERKRGREVFPGYAGSLFGGLMTLAFVYGLDNGSNPSKEEIYLVWGAGSAFVSALGVQKAGQFDDGLRTFSASFLGAIVGSGLGILAFEGSIRVDNPGLVLMVVLFGKPLLTSYGAINGYYAAAKSKYRGVVNLKESSAKLDFPVMRVHISESIGEFFPVYRLSLLNVEF